MPVGRLCGSVARRRANSSSMLLIWARNSSGESCVDMERYFQNLASRSGEILVCLWVSPSIPWKGTRVWRRTTGWRASSRTWWKGKDEALKVWGYGYQGRMMDDVSGAFVFRRCQSTGTVHNLYDLISHHHCHMIAQRSARKRVDFHSNGFGKPSVLSKFCDPKNLQDINGQAASNHVLISPVKICAGTHTSSQPRLRPTILHLYEHSAYDFMLGWAAFNLDRVMWPPHLWIYNPSSPFLSQHPIIPVLHPHQLPPSMLHS